MGLRKSSYKIKSKSSRTRVVRARGGSGQREVRCAVSPDPNACEARDGPAAPPCAPPTSPSAPAVTPAAAPATSPRNQAAVSAPSSSTPRFPDKIYEFQGGPISPVHPFRAQSGPAESAGTPLMPPKLSGRRFVHIGQFVAQIQADRHGGPFGCSFLDSTFVREHKRGFRSTLVFKCSMCSKETYLDTDKSENGLNINTALVAGAVNSGGGFANLDEIAAAADVPCMSAPTYVAQERILGRKVKEALMEKMAEAGREEKRLAEEAGDVAPDGTPWIRVVADGMWSKRSYKNKYDALSGAASIVGYRTKKVLFYGVRNKYCQVCEFGSKRRARPRQHECFKDFDGASTKMESEIILEGFQASEKMHGLRFLELVADRDASVYNTLIVNAPYGPLQLVKKIDCKNHLLRNFRSWVIDLSKNTKLPLPETVDRKDPKAVRLMRHELLTLRTLIRDNMLRMSTAISKAATHRGQESGSLENRTALLRQDIMNVAAHVFGQHDKCAQYFCKAGQRGASAQSIETSTSISTSASNDLALPVPEYNWVKRLENAGLWRELVSYLDKIAAHASSLIHNVNNNVCEMANSMTTKFIGGKRVFYSRRGSFITRCETAALAMNTSGQFRRVLSKHLQDGVSPGTYTSKQNERMFSRLTGARKRRALFKETGKSLKRRRAAGPDEDYGLNALAPEDDVDNDDEPQPIPENSDALEAKIRAHMEAMHLSKSRKDQISKIPQGSWEWLKERRVRLTASNFGAVCRRAKTVSVKVLVHYLLYTDSSNKSNAMAHGTRTESTARNHYAAKHGVVVDPCGLVLDQKHPFLAASPDGIIQGDTLLEIKCPTSAADFDCVEDAVRAKKLDYLKINDAGALYLYERSDYHFQIQGQLHITGRQKCVLYIYQATEDKEKAVFKWDHEIVIERNDAFWENEMEQNLVLFYEQALVPELVCPLANTARVSRERIREPKYVLEAREIADALKVAKEQQKEERRKGKKGKV